MKKHFCAALVFAILISCIYIPASAMENMTYEKDMTIARATGRFNMDVSANTIRKASSSFPLEVGEVVTIKASYSPFSANVDFGLIAPNGRFYYITITNGSIDRAIEVTERGNYTFAVRNNSSFEVNVSGYVNY